MNNVILRKYGVIFLLLWGVCASSLARNHYTYFDQLKESYLAVWGSLGYSQLTYSYADINNYGLPAGNLGVGYEFHKGFNNMWSIGAELSILGAGMQRVGDMTDDHDMIDNDISPYSEFTMNATFADFEETNLLGYLNIPIMYGYKVDRFYALGGVKLGFKLFSNYKSSSLLTTTGDYEWFFDDFEDMPNHYFVTNKKIEDSGKINMGVNASLSGELGYYFSIDKKEKNDWRISLQMDYGLVDINRTDRVNKELFTRTDNPIDYQLNSVFSTTTSGDVKAWFVGIKLTYLICTKSKWDCNCY